VRDDPHLLVRSLRYTNQCGISFGPTHLLDGCLLSFLLLLLITTTTEFEPVNAITVGVGGRKEAEAKRREVAREVKHMLLSVA